VPGPLHPPAAEEVLSFGEDDADPLQAALQAALHDPPDVGVPYAYLGE
jgi:hypothetical protein